MNGLDAGFIAVEDAVNHMHIGAVAIFEGPPPPFADLRGIIASKLGTGRRYRQRVRELPASIGRPVWIDDAHFNLDYHLRHTALPEPSDEALDALVGRLMSQQLDRHKPLWEMWVVEGLPYHRWALISKVHHCMVDGIAGSDLMAALMETERDVPSAAPEEWVPEPEPSRSDLARTMAGLALERTGIVTRAAARAMVHPVDTGRRVAGVMSGASRLGSQVHESPLTGPIGPHRRWTRTHCSLDDITRIRKTLGGTVNDVVLAAVTSGFRDLLLARRVPVTDRTVNTIIPVSTRTRDERGLLSNRVAALYAHLPVGIGDATELLAAISTHTTELKRSHELEAAQAVVDATALAPSMLGSLLARVVVHRQDTVETIVTNVPGPESPLYLCGRVLEQTYPYLPIAGRICLDVAVWSYYGNVYFGITGDWDHVPDIHVVARGIDRGIRDLVAATDGEPGQVATP